MCARAKMLEVFGMYAVFRQIKSNFRTRAATRHMLFHNTKTGTMSNLLELNMEGKGFLAVVIH